MPEATPSFRIAERWLASTSVPSGSGRPVVVGPQCRAGAEGLLPRPTGSSASPSWRAGSGSGSAPSTACSSPSPTRDCSSAVNAAPTDSGCRCTSWGSRCSRTSTCTRRPFPYWPPCGRRRGRACRWGCWISSTWSTSSGWRARGPYGSFTAPGTGCRRTPPAPGRFCSRTFRRRSSRPDWSTGSRRASPRTPSPTSACCSTSCGRVAERGWAQNVEESALGAVSVAAPVRDDTGAVIAAISVVGPTAGPPDAAAAPCRGDRRRSASSPRGSATGRGRTGRPDAPVPSGGASGPQSGTAPCISRRSGDDPVSRSNRLSRPARRASSRRRRDATRGTRRPHLHPSAVGVPSARTSGAHHRPIATCTC